jgi:hypothetical protein
MLFGSKKHALDVLFCRSSMFELDDIPLLGCDLRFAFANTLFILVVEAYGFVECNALRIPSARGKSIGLFSVKR